jgi:predicted dehydrogenase
VIDLVLIGAGNRGNTFGELARRHHADAVRFVAVAEPNPIRRGRFAAAHRIPAERCFESWEDLVALGQLGEGALVCTTDPLHERPTNALLELGYDVLLEKPMAPTLEACMSLVRTAERTGRHLMLGHSMRYTDYFMKVREIVQSGELGEIITVEHRENVSYDHSTHSYVRGSFRRADLCGSMLLAKCCHDLDVLVWTLGSRPKRISSIGSLRHFRAESVGPEIPERCTDGCPIERECPFSAIQIYLEARPYAELRAGLDGPADEVTLPYRWPFKAISHDLSPAGRLKALREGPWGRCVYRCDNDVVDNQIVTMEFENGVSVVLAMHGHSHEDYRSMRYDGTHGTLRGRVGMLPGSRIELDVHDHFDDRRRLVPTERVEDGIGHIQGGDHRLFPAFLRVLRGEETPRTSARESLESHLMAFAAEEARLTGTVVEMDDFRRAADAIPAGTTA